MTPLLALALALLQSPADHRLCERSLQPSRYASEAARIDALAAGGSADAATLFAQGCRALREERWEPAVAAFQRAVKSAPDNALYHLWLGRAYAEQATRANKLRQATLAGKIRDSFARAVQLDADYIEARLALGEFYAQAPGVMGGSEEKALEQVREVRARNPYRGALAAATLAQSKGRPAEAERELVALVASHPDSLVPYVNLINTYLRTRRFEEARRTATRLEAIPRGTMLAQYVIGRIAAESGERLESGRAALERYLGHSPTPDEPSLAYAHYRLGMIHAQLGDTAAARAAYQQALTLDPSHGPAKDALAKLR